MKQFNELWIYMDDTNKQTQRASIELLAKAQKLAKEAGMKAVPVTLPKGSYVPEAIVRSLKAAVIAENPFALLFGFTPLGKEISAGLSAALDLGIASNCTNIIYRKNENDFMFIRPTYDGKLNATITLKTYPQLASFSAGTFPLGSIIVDTEANKKVLEISEDSTAIRTRFLECIESAELASANIEEADVLIAGGRGVGSKEGFEMLKELAALLGGNIAATRGAVDDGYISKDYQVGATGKTVSPKLYIACGISGAPAHVVGMKDSETIVAINTNASEPIFDVAHYRIVGDLHQVLPELIKILKERK